MGGDGDLNRSRKKNYRKKHKRTPSMYCELSSCSEAFDFKNGVKYIFSNQFVSSGLQETFIMPDELYEAILCLDFPVVFFLFYFKTPSTPAVLENAAVLQRKWNTVGLVDND